MITLDKIISEYDKFGYKVFTNDTKAFNLNIYGIRKDNIKAGVFDDELGVFWRYKGLWNWLRFRGTTDPGRHYLMNPLNKDGCFILAKGQHRNMWKLGTHKGKIAFQQINKVKGFRDDNGDDKLDFDSSKSVEGIFGINGHYSGNSEEEVGRWSAGCQVWACNDEHSLMMELAGKAIKNFSNSFTYTLLEEKDF